MTVSLNDATARYDSAVSRARHAPALAVVDELLASGVEPLTIMTDVIAAVQRRVGERWQSGEWSVAQEHAATSLSVAAVEAVDRAAAPGPARGRVVVACAEREWHALPAALIATGLRSTGWEVTLLGASTPTGRLSRYLQDLGPDATAVSCSVAQGLPNAHDFIQASTTAGIPVLAGGAAFGPDSRRATALGATAWAPDLCSAVELVASLPKVVASGPRLADEVARERAALQQVGGPLVELVVLDWGGLPDSPEAWSTTEAEDLLRIMAEQVFHAVVGALVTGDGRLVRETVEWARDIAVSRGLGVQTWELLGRCMASGLEGFPLAARIWEERWPGSLRARGTTS